LCSHADVVVPAGCSRWRCMLFDIQVLLSIPCHPFPAFFFTLQD
jgi:hypothetical protein